MEVRAERRDGSVSEGCGSTRRGTWGLQEFPEKGPEEQRAHVQGRGRGDGQRPEAVARIQTATALLQKQEAGFLPGSFDWDTRSQ